MEHQLQDQLKSKDGTFWLSQWERIERDIADISDDAGVLATRAVEVEVTPSKAFELQDIAFNVTGSRRLSLTSRKSIASHFTEAYNSRASVVDLPNGLSSFICACVMVNYISAGYVLLPWGMLPVSMVL